MMKVSYTLVLTLLMLNPLLVSADTLNCTKDNAPLTDKPDYDGNGIVNGKDIVMLNSALKLSSKTGFYSALYDRDGNGELNNVDRYLTTREMSQESSEADQDIAKEILEGTYVCGTTGSGGWGE